jgi:hypothetical protein
MTPIVGAHCDRIYPITALFSGNAANALLAQQMEVVIGQKAAANRARSNGMVFPSHAFPRSLETQMSAPKKVPAGRFQWLRHPHRIDRTLAMPFEYHRQL